MLVIMTETQILSPQQVCQGCLLADHQGRPRWRHGKLGCALATCGHSGAECSDRAPAGYYECQMGFRLTNIEPVDAWG